MEAAALVVPPLTANQNAGLRLALVVTDPEVAHELAQRPEGTARDAFAAQALRIGVLALRQASGALDAQTVQREGERLLSAVRDALTAHTSQTMTGVSQVLGGYLDPRSGSLPQRLDRLTQPRGELDALLAGHLDGDRSTLSQSLAKQIGQGSPIFKLLSPEQAGGLVATLTRGIDAALTAQRDIVLREFSRDRPDSALSRLVCDITAVNGQLRGDLAGQIAGVTGALTLDDPASPLSRLRGEMLAAVGAFADSNARFQSDVRTTLESFKVRREEAARGSLHGHTFEDAAGELLQREAQRGGDVCERLSGTPGTEGRKTGDYVLVLGPESAAPGARITVECKAERGYSESAALDELALARKNRGAQIGVFVVARQSAKEGFSTLRRVGQDILVTWDAEDPASDVYLTCALTIAKAIVVQQHGGSGQAEADAREIEQSVLGIERLVTAVESIAHDARNIVKKGQKIGRGADLVKERLLEEVGRLRGVVEGGRDAPGNMSRYC